MSSPSWKTTTPVHQTHSGSGLGILVKTFVLLASTLSSSFLRMNVFGEEPGKLSHQTNNSSNQRQGRRTMLLSRVHTLRRISAFSERLPD